MVSTYGRIYRAPFTNSNNRFFPGQIVSTWDKAKGKDGKYIEEYTKLNIHGRRKNRLVSGLVAETFLGPKPPGYEIDHDDNNPTNNVLTNLSYVTTFYNNAKKPTNKLNLQMANEIRHKYAKGDTSYSKLADEYGVTPESIGGIIRLENWNPKSHLET